MSMAPVAPSDRPTGAGPARVEWIRDPARFAALAEPWDELAALHPAPFGRHAWFAAWWDAFGAGRELAICALWRDAQLAAVFPLSRSGRRLAALANLHSPRFRPLARDAEALAEVVGAAFAAGAGELVVANVPVAGPESEALARAARDAGWLALATHRHASPVVELGGDLESYLRARKLGRGSGVERKRRKAEREHEVAFTLVEAPVDLEREFEAGFAVEGSGWKGARGTAVLADPATATFYRRLAEAFAARGELRLSRMELDGQVVAFDFSLLSANRLYLLKTGYDERFRALAPGLVLRLGIVERCFELGLETHELLGADDAWKRKFSTTEREQEWWRCYPRRPVPAGRYVYRRAVRPALADARARLARLRAASSS